MKESKESGGGPLTLPSPFRELQEMRNLMSGVLEDVFTGGDGRALAGPKWLPAVDVDETDKEYRFSVELPGLEKGDYKVEVKNGVLAVSGEKKTEKEEKKKNYLRREQYFGSFRRLFTLPADADAEGIKASCKNGVLKIAVPRSAKAKSRSVQVKVD